MKKKMNILVVNEFKYCGGAEIYTQNLIDVLKNNEHRVSALYYSCDSDKLEPYEHVVRPSLGKLDKGLIDPFMYKNARGIINKINPDIIIVNNLFSSPFTQYALLSGYKTIQIVHDYSAICPTSTCITDKDYVCDGLDGIKCVFNCKYHNSKIKIFFKYLLTLITMHYRMRYIQRFISPSKMLCKYLHNKGYRCSVVSNPIIVGKYITINRVAKNTKKYIYIGGMTVNKGICELLDAFHIFAIDKNVELNLYGPLSDENVSRKISENKDEKIKYCGIKKHGDINNILREGYALIVPSKWMENYPTIVLEGLANQILVIGSDRGGIPELLNMKRGIVYPFGIDTLVKALEDSHTLTNEEYYKIVQAGYEYVRKNNAITAYYDAMIKIIKDI